MSRAVIYETFGGPEVGTLSVPIAAVFPIEQIRDVVILQAGRRVHGKVVVTL
jgi:hypothetical protein